MSPSTSPEQRAQLLHDLVAQALHTRAQRVVLPAGDHIVAPGLLPDRLVWISNNDSGVKPILFDLSKAENFELDGNGARILVIGVLLPVLLQGGRNVTLRNLTIDWVRPGFTEAVTLSAGNGGFEFSTAPGADSFHVVAGRLTASGGGEWPSGHLYNVLAFDSKRKEPVARSEESWQIERTHRATDLGQGRFRIDADFSSLPAPGSALVFMHGDRVAPAIVLDGADDTTLEDVTVHHALGMAVVAQACRGLIFRRVKVVPSGDRLFSTWVDALHTVDCGRLVLLEDCELRGMFDDGANLHGAHRRVSGWKAPNVVVLESMHHQQHGVLYNRAGDILQFANAEGLQTLCEAGVLAVRQITSRRQELLLDRALPALASVRAVARRAEPNMLTEVRGCRIGPNRGRALLLSNPGKIRVEGNHLHSSGNAIELPTEASYWWESGPVEDVRIRGNHFDACGFAMCGRHLLIVAGPRGEGTLHGQVEFTDNRCDLAGGAIVEASRLRRLVLRGNAYARHPDYPWQPEPQPVQLHQVEAVEADPMPEFLSKS